MRKLVLTLGCVLALSAQDSPFPKPTAHHLAMKDQAGTWTAVAKMYMEPGKPPMVSKGTETNTLVAGDLWLKSILRAEMMGQMFETQVDRDHRSMVMYSKAKDGTFVRSMEIDYVRAK
jgi:hypothetical protein